MVWVQAELLKQDWMSFSMSSLADVSGSLLLFKSVVSSGVGLESTGVEGAGLELDGGEHNPDKSRELPP